MKLQTGPAPTFDLELHFERLAISFVAVSLSLEPRRRARAEFPVYALAKIYRNDDCGTSFVRDGRSSWCSVSSQVEEELEGRGEHRSGY